MLAFLKFSGTTLSSKIFYASGALTGSSIQGHCRRKIPRAHCLVWDLFWDNEVECFFQFMESWWEWHPMLGREMGVSQKVFQDGGVVVEKALEVVFPAVQDGLKISKEGGTIWVLKDCWFDGGHRFPSSMHKSDAYLVGLHIVGFPLPLPTTRCSGLHGVVFGRFSLSPNRSFSFQLKEGSQKPGVLLIFD